jgi:hypothetical protein
VGVSGDCLVKVAAGLSSTSSGSVGASNAVRIAVGDGDAQLVGYDSAGVSTSTPAFTGIDVSDSLDVTFKLSKTGTTAAVTNSALGLVVKDLSGTNREVYAVLNGVDVALDGSVTIQDSATLKMFAKDSSQSFSKTLTNSGANIFDATDNQVTVNFNNLRTAILNENPALNVNVAEDGYYQYKLVVGAAIPVGTLTSSVLSPLPRIAGDQSSGLDLVSLYTDSNINAGDTTALSGGSLIQGHFQINGATGTAQSAMYPASWPGALTLSGTPYTLSQGGTNNQVRLTVDGTNHTVAMASTGEVTTDSFTGVDTSDSVSVTFDLSGSGDASGSLGFAVEDLSGTGRKIYAVLDQVTVTAGTVSVPSNAKLYVYAVKSDSSSVAKIFTNASVNMVDASGSEMTLSLSNLRDNIQSEFIAQGLSSDLSSFASPDGYYSYTILVDDGFPLAYKTATDYSSLPRIPLSTLAGPSLLGTEGYFNNLVVALSAASTSVNNLADAHRIYGEVQINGATQSVSTANAGFSLSVEGLTGTTTTGSDATGTFQVTAAETSSKTYITSTGTETNDATTSNIEVFASVTFSVTDASGTVTIGNTIQLDTGSNNSLTIQGVGINNSFTFASDATDVFTVNSSGVITSVGAGTGTLTITDSTYSNISKTITISVSATALAVTVTDSDWSTNSTTVRKTVTAGETIQVDISANNGVVTASGPVSSAGSGSVTNGVLSWTAPESGAFAGDYTVTVTDPLGLTASIYVTVPYSLKVSSVGGTATDARGMLATEIMQVTAAGAAASTSLTFTVMDSNDSTDTSAFITDSSDSVTADASGTAVAGIDPSDTLTAITTFKVKVSDGSDTDLDSTLSGLTIFPTDAYVFTVTSDGTTALSGATVLATTVNQNDGTPYVAATDASGSAQLNVPKHPVSGSFHTFTVVKDGYVAQNVTPSALSTTVTLTAAVRTISGTVSGLPSTGTKIVTVSAFYDSTTVRVIVADQKLIVGSNDTSGTFSIAMNSSEYDAARSYTLLGRVKGYTPATSALGTLTVDATGTSLDFSSNAITVTADTTAARTTATTKLASIFSGDSNASAIATEIAAAKAVIEPPAVSATTGVEFSFENYSEASLGAETVAALQKIAMSFPPLKLTDASSTITPLVHIPETGGLSSTQAAKLESTPVSFNLSLADGAGTVQTKSTMNAFLQAAYDAGNPVQLCVPRGDISAADILSGTKVIRFADTLEALVDDTLASSVSTSDIVDAGALTGQVCFNVAHLTVFGGGAAIASSAAAAVAGGGGCFIATAAYGSYEAPYVKLLRDFRDQVLLTNGAGQWFVEQYYSYSPPAADWIREREAVKSVVRLALVPLIATSWVILEASLMQQLLVLFGMVGLFLLPGVIRRQRNRVPTAG